MRVVQVTKDGALELNWMWLPTFIGQNYMLLKQLEAAWKERHPQGLIYTEDALDEMHDFTIGWFTEKLNIEGLRDYLEAIESVRTN